MLDKALSVVSVFALFLLLILSQYVFLTLKWILANKFGKLPEFGTKASKIPPQYPYLFPGLGNAPSFIWNNANFICRATSFKGKLISSRINFLGFEIYAFQDRHTIAKIWKQPTLSSPISMFVYVLRFFFGLPESVVAVYRNDNSGPFPKPYKGSNVPVKDRIDYITHHGFHRALGGPDLMPTTRRYMTALAFKLEEKDFAHEWTDMADLSDFFKDIVGSALIETLYGPAMLRINPNFMQDLWDFDISVPWFARAVPSWIKPSVYKSRQNCVDQLKKWYAYARQHFDESHISPDGDGDPYWGSNLMRYRQEKLLAVKYHDDDSLARMDLGLAWGAVGNTIPCAMLSAFHIFKDPDLLQRVRSHVESSFADPILLSVDPYKLAKEPLLSSIYAETLRFYVKTYFVVSSPHTHVDLGRWTLPRGRIGLMNAGVSHMDDAFWNSRNGEFPVTSFSQSSAPKPYKTDPNRPRTKTRSQRREHKDFDDLGENFLKTASSAGEVV